MDISTKHLLLYIAESILEQLQSDCTANDREEVVMLGKRVEALGRYVQSRGTGHGYMKMTKTEFLLLHSKEDDDYDCYLFKADEIESEGGFIDE